MPRFAKRTVLALLLGFVAPQAPAQDAGERRVIPVSVLDREGNLVTSLTAADFRGEFRGQPVKIVSVTRDTRARRIALLVDTSAGMGRPMDKWRFAWWAAGYIASKLPETCSLALLTVALGTRRYSGLTTDRVSFEEAFSKAQRQRPVGATTVHDGIVEAGRVFSPAEFGDVVFVVSDVEDTYSTKTPEEVNTALTKAGVRAYILLVPGWQSSDGRKYAQEVSRSLADATGGRVFELQPGRQPSAEIAVKLEPFLATMLDLYRVEIEFPVHIDKEREWKLEVEGGHGVARQDLELAYPRLLVPGASKSTGK